MKRILLVCFCLVLLFFSFGCKKKAEKEEKAEPAPSTLQEKPESRLPEEVAQVVKQYFPAAEAEAVETEKVAGTTLYDIEFKENQGEIELAADGTIIDISKVVSWEELPEVVAQAIKEVVAANNANVTRIERAEVHAEIKGEGEAATINKVDTPYFLYEAELKKDGQKGEITVDSTGKIIEGPKWGN